MRFDVVTIFPGMFGPVFRQGVIGRAIERGVIGLAAHDLREYTRDRHRQVDDMPFGGGPGMVMKPEPVIEAVEALRTTNSGPVVLMEPWGEMLDQNLAADLASQAGLIIVSGRYEGIDDRVRTALGAREISIGDYVLSGGEPAALVIVDATVRLLEGAMSDMDSARTDSHWSGGLSAPSYTRPATYRGFAVPDVLMSGDHKRIDAWRLAEGERLTRERLASDAAPGTRHADEPPHP